MLAWRTPSLVLACLLCVAACGDPDDDRTMGSSGLGFVEGPITANVCPDGTTTFGIDVSKWQGTIDWAKVKGAGVKYAFIRVSDGVNTIDTEFATNWAKAKQNGILRGAYQFFRPGQNAVTQANVLLDHVAAEGAADLPPVLDVEATDGQSAATIATKIGQWMERVEGVLGVKPIIYTGGYFWESNVASAAFADNPLWVAHWTNGCPSIPKQWSDWTFHQYSATGSVDGISGDVDLDRFNGTLAELQALGGGGAASLPKLSIDVQTFPPAGQAADFRPEGTSKDKLDLYEGQTFTADVYVTNATDGATTTEVDIGVWFESPYLVPVGYTIYTDWPKKDRATWVVNDANDHPQNPAHAAPTSGEYFLYAMSPGETKRVSFTVRATQYSIGQVDHPDVRAWVWHVPDYYGEQTGWNDAVETNNAGSVLRDYVQHDVYARDRWTFQGPDPAETEGWSEGHAISATTLDLGLHALSFTMTGADPYVRSGPAAIDAGAMKGIGLHAQTTGGAKLSRLYFVTAADPQWGEDKAVSFVTPGDGAMHDLSIDLSHLTTWTGTVTQLRLDPATDDTARFLLADLAAVASVAATSGDADGDGVVGAPGPDCDDHDLDVAPGKAELCDGVDDDCDGETDEGFELGTGCASGSGACLVTGTMVCTADGRTTHCDAAPPAGCGPACLPGVTGPCPRAGVAAGCEVGVRQCLDDGTWGACVATPECGGPGGETGEDASSGPDAGAEVTSGGDAATATASDAAEGGKVSALVDDGCAGAGAGGTGAMVALALGLVMLARRRSHAPVGAAVAAVGLGLTGCGDDGGTSGATDVVTTPDVRPTLDIVFIDAATDTQVIGFDSATSATDTAAPRDVGASDGVAVASGPAESWGFTCDGAGGPGCACDGGCAAGLGCVDTALGPQCLATCEGACAEGLRCLTVGDGVRACVPAWQTLCGPCDTQADCLEVGAACVDFGFDGSFCALPCEHGSACPGGYECKTLGQPAQTVCVPTSLSCSCGPVATALGMGTTCQSDDGSACTGRRTCGARGLSTCDAGGPETEVCNGRDDDCDGETDEGCDGDGDDWCAGAGGPDVVSPACPKGFGDCRDDDAAVHPKATEECNGRDDDCDGATDGQSRACQGTCGAGAETCTSGHWGGCTAQAALCDAADPCCQASGCAYEPASVKCDASPVGYERRCSGDCGGTVQVRAQYRFCSGTAAGCGATNLQWGAWGDEAACGTGLCTASGGAASCTACQLGCTAGQCVTQTTTVVCIDPGYGPADTPSSNGVLGHQVTWSVAQHLKAWLEADTNKPAGGGTWSVVLTRAADTTPTGAQRKATCDAAGAQRVIAIGVNGFDGTAHGSETYRKQTADAAWTSFATQVQAQVVGKGGLSDRGVKVGTFTILSTVAPSVWTFLGFLDNATDRAKLDDDAWRNTVAQGLLFALQQSMGYATYTP